ncbi:MULTISPECIES: polysaccharide biosynthesis/export family protein [unclassified Myroides]|uniref:polysaccharide biosynthesis/export family protein n=1 Tax=unclassified Myroides TaxID=2642485 RepID=UPI0015FE005E|nr:MULTISPECIES: polysaccharide biosynthesis/export family protein [unclassified Myroides]MBB1150357.1 polysaccharide biosynthesis/export family protein [Myroides sp. NP-2]MDM1407975.1 polysaccharide biosynthesis/export family protein [Myroides sp. DF42-4-2]
MKLRNLFVVLLITTTVFLTSCASRESMVYYQNIEEVLAKNNTVEQFETYLQPDDLLMIIVSAQDREAAEPFNLVNTMLTNLNNPAGTGSAQQQLYLVDNKGNIEFPVLGTVKISGLTKKQAIDYLTTEISKYIIRPIVNMRIMNYKITVQGEVNRPGIHTVVSERLTLADAIALSGDLTVYGKRDNILVIREVDGKRIPYRVDMTKADFITSPYYYLNQNDIVYVEPNKTKVNSSVIGPNLTVGISALSLLITIISIATR